MNTPQEREQTLALFSEAVTAGARRKPVAAILNIALRTIQRWLPSATTTMLLDQRPLALRPVPSNKLTAAEYAQVTTVVNSVEYASLPPSQIVPKLADKGIYIASESTFYRILRAEGLLNHRGDSRAPQAGRVKTTHLATAMNQVWMWDITWLPSNVKGKYYYLYQVIDLYSRFGVAWEVHEVESGELAATLMQQAVLREKTQSNLNSLVLHSDNGGAMKSKTLSAKLADLGVVKSHSRPRVSDDNAYIESFFRTLKYCPKFPRKGFDSMDAARLWTKDFMQWYNFEHQHSKISFVTPAQRHCGEDLVILAQRKVVYADAKAAHPNRWSGNTRSWEHISTVALNPEAETHVKLETAA